MAQDRDIDLSVSLSLLETFESSPWQPTASTPQLTDAPTAPAKPAEDETSEDSTNEADEDDEIAQLKRRNKDLDLQNEDLLLRVAELEAALARSNRIIHEISLLRKPFANLPPEILSTIFERTILPSFLVDVSTSSGPDSIWGQTLAQKLSIILVCRRWYHIGIPFLYDEVHIRQIYQLPLLIRSLEANKELPPRLKSLTFYCLIPLCYRRQTRNLISQLFSLCPNLAAFSYASPCPLPDLDTLPPLSPKIMRLHLGDTSSNTILLNTLSESSRRLVSLSISSPLVFTMPSNDTTIPFDSLTDLVVEFNGRTVNNLLSYFSKWTTPQLTRLTFKLRGNPSAWRMSELTNVMTRFCNANGRNITYFHVHPEYWWFMLAYAIEMEPVLQQLPKLTHLVIHPRTVGSLSHPTVEWIDVWQSHILAECMEEWQVMFMQLNKENFPALKGVRTISSALAWFPTIPRLIPPECAVGHPSQTTFAFEFQGFRVKHDSTGIRSVVEEWPDEDDEGQDSTYEYPSDEESESDGSSSWASTESGNFNIQQSSEAGMELLPKVNFGEDGSDDDDNSDSSSSSESKD